MSAETTPDLCCMHGERIDRILDLLEDRKAKREPKDGVYRVTVPPASRAQMRAEAQQIEAQSAAGTYDHDLMPAVVERLAQAARGINLDPKDHA